ncbi:putative mitochondrial hypothetical protein [Leptomonas pyrrhocoris]|uniref:Treble clef zinc finger domain-containing protein n=1 Tax=Leptomonas pyrrhocoris TaxID=157538 RepID=A0A0M9FYC9_LEPPY|nr:putative mitochondrial hypothetical protein [Leptomonas pyrrhocoris]KPA78483.1 putative mitochondrial hypothetical protein [Leptomonas pyrrhocoris]|eukprot:XP_015656922.1 putative mitochondrial hypothetical protein [Leptomonas pyrrhocoris]
MLRQTCVLAAAEFKQKSRWSGVWPNMHYGAMYLQYSVGRQLPMQGVNWVTRDSNRLVNFSARYQSVIDDVDVKRNEEELQIALTDVRWNDHRRIFWRCSFCGASYRKSVSVRIKYHAGCNFCKGRYASEVLREQTVVQPLKETQPNLFGKLAENERNDNVGSLGVTSKFRAQWTCSCCGQPYRATIRSRTGLVEPGQTPLHPQITQWTSVCPSCAWNANMKSLAERTMKEGQFLGLDASLEEVAAAGSTKKIPRRKKMVV